MALGTIGVLLILVTGLATTYIRELKLSRTTYDEVIAEASAEGMFEYAMLKVRNHREGFADSVTSDNLDGKMLTLSTDRSKNLKSSYTIEASSTEYTFTVPSNTHLILPLFSSNEIQINTSGKSKNPQFNTWTKIVQDLSVTWVGDLSWTIVAMSGSESVGITGSGDIGTTSIWTFRKKWFECYAWDGIGNDMLPDGSDCNYTEHTLSDGTKIKWERVDYFYDNTGSVQSFMKSEPFNNNETDLTKQITMNISDPYIIIYNTGSEVKITVKWITPFALPTLTVTSSAQKNDTLQTFRFVEDKSRYYDALKYGVYAQ